MHTLPGHTNVCTCIHTCHTCVYTYIHHGLAQHIIYMSHMCALVAYTCIHTSHTYTHMHTYHTAHITYTPTIPNNYLNIAINNNQMSLCPAFFPSSPEDMLTDFRERGKKGRKREISMKESYIDWLSSHMHQDQGSNPKSFSVQDDAPNN